MIGDTCGRRPPGRKLLPQKVLLPLAGVFLFGLLPAYGQEVYLNEIMASNSETIADEDGDFEDWIELYNAGSTPVNLEGYGLSDDYDRPMRWVFPAVTISPGRFLLVWASGKDRREPGGPLHTSFSIKQAGEEVLFTAPDGTRLDELQPVPVPTDLSIGRQPDGTGDWFFFTNPTPGAANTTTGFQEIADPPVFSSTGGFYDDPIELSLSSPRPGTTIYYTTDGSDPGPESRRYEAPILIRDRTPEPNDISEIRTNSPNVREDERWRPPVGQVAKGTVVRAIAYRPGSIPSGISTHTFFVGQDLAGRYRLPVISIATDRDNLFDPYRGIYVPGHFNNYFQRGEEWERPAHMEFFETGGSPGFALDCGLRIHGGTSRSRPIKSLRVYARGRYGTSTLEYRLFPDKETDEFRRFILRNSGNDWDRSFFRDALMQRLVQHTDLDLQHYRPAVVFINGEYWGLHNIRDRIDDHFLGIRHGVDRDDLVILERNGALKQGTDADARRYMEMLSFIENYSPRVSANYEHVKTLMDVDNFIDFQIAHIFFRNTDWPGNNVEYWRKRTAAFDPDAAGPHDGRWRWLLFDTDFGFDLDFDYVPGRTEGYHHNTLAFATRPDGPHWPNPPWSTFLLRSLLESDEFRNRFINRFADLLNTAFREDRVVDLIEDFADVLRPHMPEHIDRWGGPESMSFWENEVRRMIVFAGNRPTWQRRHLTSYFGLSGEASVRIRVSDPEAGRVRVNSVLIDPDTPGVDAAADPWEGIYFRGVPIRLVAEPFEDYRFAGWTGTFSSEEDTLRITPSSDVDVTAVFEPAATSSSGESPAERSTRLHPVSPHPVRETASFRFSVSEPGRAVLSIFDVLGREIQTVFSGAVPEGTHSVEWNAAGLAPGVYLYRVETRTASESRRFVIVR